MPSKEFELPSGQTVQVYKSKTNKNLRITIAHNGQVRVSMPQWLPYKVGVDFARQKQSWIDQNAKYPSLIVEGQQVGKAHRVNVIEKPGITSVTSRVSNTEITVCLPSGTNIESDEAQQEVQKAGIRALRQEANKLLPMRLSDLAARHGFRYKDVSIKQLKRRWGSCDQQKSIKLSLYLMQLPWELIDYVLLHELTHTVSFGHGKDFWQKLEAVLPDARKRQKELRKFSPLINA